MLAMDHSGLDAGHRRVAVAARAATVAAGEAFLGEVPARRQGRRRRVRPPRRGRPGARRPTAPRCVQALREAMRPSGGTATGDALATSLAMLRAQAGQGGKPPARGRRPALRRHVHPRPRPAAGRRRGPRAGHPRLHGGARHARRARSADGERVPARRGGAAGDRRALGRRGVHRRAGRRAQRGLRAARLPGRHASASSARSPPRSRAARSLLLGAGSACRCSGSAASSDALQAALRKSRLTLAAMSSRSRSASWWSG